MLLLLLFLPRFALLNGNDSKFKSDFEFFTDPRLPSFKSTILWSLFANFLSNHTPCITLFTAKLLHEPPKLFSLVKRFPSMTRSLIVRSLILNERFCSVSRYMIELEWITVEGNSTSQLYFSWSNCFCVENVFARFLLIEFIPFVEFSCLISCLPFTDDVWTEFAVNRFCGSFFSTEWRLSPFSCLSYGKN